jgi:CheY-like chemotaxis protein
MPHKLLLADDSVTIQRVIELTFAEEDVQVLAVGDGQHAIDRIQAERPDIVLADVGMPERDGYEVAAFVKGNPQLAHIPVILLTGAFEPIDESRARAVGCDGVLVKPFEPQMVINRVKDLLSGKRPVQASAAQGQGMQPAAAADAGQASFGDAPKQGDSLEDYFDRLDAAFATLGDTAPPPAASHAGVATVPQPAAVAASRPATVEDFASWDPDLAGDANRPALHEPPQTFHAPVAAPPPAAAPVPPVSVHVSVTAPPAPPVTASVPPAVSGSSAAATVAPAIPAAAPSQVSLAEAFAALLAAENGQVIAPPARAAAAPSADVVEEIVRRVLDRLQDQDMRQTVVDVAERLVREEIDKIKRSNG